MRTFGRFRLEDGSLYGEVRGEEVHLFGAAVLARARIHRRRPFVRRIADRSSRSRPRKLIAVGLNYADHIAEMKRTPLGTPLIWFKAPRSLLPHKGTIEIAFPEHKTDFETELAIVIGRRAKNVSRSSKRSNTSSVTRSAKTSAIAICRNPKNNFRAANLSTPTRRSGRLFIPMSTLAICRSTLRQNGEVKQQARTSQMIYSVAEIVSFASQSMTLLPGDVDSHRNAFRSRSDQSRRSNWRRESATGRRCSNRVGDARAIEKFCFKCQFAALRYIPLRGSIRNI